MLLVLDQHLDLDELSGLLDGQSDTTTLVCCSDGVYLAHHIAQQWPHITCFALTADCESRGVDAPQTLSHSEWVELSFQHKQWISLAQ